MTGLIAWLLHIGGVDDPTSNYYGFWSGIGSDIPELVGLVLVIRRLNCHAHHCWRIGLHRVHGTHYVTCRHHHPDHPGGAPATAEQIADTYRRTEQ